MVHPGASASRFGFASRHPSLRGELLTALGISVSAVLVGYLAVNNHLPSAVALAILPLMLWLLFRPRLIVSLLAVSIPFPASLLSSGGLNVAASDVLLSLIFFVFVSEALITRGTQMATALRLLVLPLAPYLGWMVVLLVAHPGVVSLLQSCQRLELFLFPVVIGVTVALRGLELTVLRAYLATATVFAGMYPIFSTSAGGLGAQKNPAGQFIADGLLLVIAVKELRGRFLLAVPVLLLGLFWTQSRGGILSVVVGLTVLLLMHPGRDRLRFLALMVPVAGVAAGAFMLLPSAAQERNTSFQVTKETRSGDALVVREEFRVEAWRIIRAEPVFGTGIGSYFDGVDGIHPSTVDPHQVLLLQAAEGGYPLGGCFVVLVLGSAGVIAWRGRRTTLGPAAVALLLAVVGHGLVDVYWVRGTPVLSWLVIGMAVGQVHLKGAMTAREKVHDPTELVGVAG